MRQQHLRIASGIVLKLARLYFRHVIDRWCRNSPRRVGDTTTPNAVFLQTHFNWTCARRALVKCHLWRASDRRWIRDSASTIDARDTTRRQIGGDDVGHVTRAHLQPACLPAVQVADRWRQTRSAATSNE